METGDDRGPPVSAALFIAFVRALIRNTHNGDVIHLALAHAKHTSGASEEEVQTLVQAIRNEHPICNQHPDFYGKF